MSKPPAAKPKVQPKKTGQNSKDAKKEAEEVDTSKDEEFARMLQEEMYSEQEELDATLARRLQEEERNKQRAEMTPLYPRPNLPPGGRPMSATPIQQLFQTLFHLRPQASELEEDDENEETTPAMEPDESPVGATGTSLERPRPGLGRAVPGRSPSDRPQRGARAPRFSIQGNRGRGMLSRPPADSDSPSDSPSEPIPDLLPGVRVNPNRARGCRHPIGRRIYFNLNPGNREVEEERQSEARRPLGARQAVVPHPGLGPREGTMPPPEGEYEPDLMILDSPNEQTREDNFVHIMRDPFLLMLLLMGRDPTFMVPDDIDVGDYEALWELAERLGEVQSRGMKPEDIAKLKPDIYRRKPSESDGEPEKCSVCLSDYKNGDKCITLQCGHVYHQECLVEWLKRNATCPVCRKEVQKAS